MLVTMMQMQIQMMVLVHMLHTMKIVMDHVVVPLVLVLLTV